MKEEDEWLRVSEVCRRYGVTTATVRQWCNTGRVEAQKRSGEWIVRVSSISRLYEPQGEEYFPVDPEGGYMWVEPYRPKPEWYPPKENTDGKEK